MFLPIYTSYKIKTIKIEYYIQSTIIQYFISEHNDLQLIIGIFQINLILKILIHKLQIKTINTNILLIYGIGISIIQSGASMQLHVRTFVNHFDIDITCYTMSVMVHNLWITN